MNIEQILKLLELEASVNKQEDNQTSKAPYIGQKSIIRTYSAGCWYGKVINEHGEKIELTAARRLWKWHANEGISLSGVALTGIDEGKSRIEPPLGSVWLIPMEIIQCSDAAIDSIEKAPNTEKH